MINLIEIQNFKCFQTASKFEFSKLNLLTGINGRGKSTLLQSILILSQSAWKNPNLKNLIINGELLQLGNFDDIKNSETLKGDFIQFSLKIDSPLISDIFIQFEGNADKPLIADFVRAELVSKGKKIEIEPKKKKIDELIQTFSSIMRRIHFVSADRLGPVKYVDKVNVPEFINVGPRGEFTINILADYLNLPNVLDDLCIGNDAKHLLQQTQDWLNYILEGGKIKIEGQERTSSVLTMLLNNRNNSYSYKPANVGFGYSYILPLIVTGLIAKPGEIIIVENPEAHLHPRAQARLSEFFTKVASCGIQVFIESHSEHILNGLRIGALNSEIGIKNDDLTIHYFNESFISEKLIINEKGKIENWPYGFFDQQEIDLSTIFKLTL
jgi:predicted ATPase